MTVYSVERCVKRYRQRLAFWNQWSANNVKYILKMAAQVENKNESRVVLIAVDGSHNSENAFQCEFFF